MSRSTKSAEVSEGKNIRVQNSKNGRKFRKNKSNDIQSAIDEAQDDLEFIQEAHLLDQ